MLFIRDLPTAVLVLPLLAILSGLSACGGLSNRITETTGMTLAERCAYYRGIAGALDMRAAGGHLTETEETALTFAKGFLSGCPAPGAPAPPKVPAPVPSPAAPSSTTSAPAPAPAARAGPLKPYLDRVRAENAALRSVFSRSTAWRNVR